MKPNIKYILTDIEGTTTSVSFVYDVLFPYFREHVVDLLSITSSEVTNAFRDARLLHEQETGISGLDDAALLDLILCWSLDDRKVTPLKTLQGILWKNAYESGAIKAHVYDDVPLALSKWLTAGIQLAVFSSGSVAAQKLLFKYANQGDLSSFFSAYFDTTSGSKRDAGTYSLIAEKLGCEPQELLFLSDIQEELVAASTAGCDTIQLVRPGNFATWHHAVNDFSQI